MKLVAEGLFGPERCTEVQNQERSVVEHQRRVGGPVLLGHQVGQVPWQDLLVHQTGRAFHQLNVGELLPEMYLVGMLHQGFLDGKELLVA